MKPHRLALLLPAFTLLLGAQCIRVLLSITAWYLRDTLYVSDQLMVGYAIMPFGLAFAAPLLVRLFKPRGALWLAGGGLALFRLLEQLSTRPAVDMWAALGGVTCFLWMLSLLYGRARANGAGGARTFSFGLLLGLSLDTALRGLTGTLELGWFPGVQALLAVTVLVATFGFMLWRVTRGRVLLADEGFVASMPLLGLGPLLFIHWQILQNQGWVGTLTGWTPGAALGWIMLGNVGALLAATAVFRGGMIKVALPAAPEAGFALPGGRLGSEFAPRPVLSGAEGTARRALRPDIEIALTSPSLRARWWPLLSGGALTIAVAFAEQPGWPFALGALAGLVSSGALLAEMVGRARQVHPRPGSGFASLALGAGMSLFVTLVALYYLSLGFRLPLPQASLAPFAGMVVTLCALASVWLRLPARPPQAICWRGVRRPAPSASSGQALSLPKGLPTSADIRRRRTPTRNIPARLGAWLLLVPLGLLLAQTLHKPKDIQGDGYPVRVLTYNIRSAFGTQGRQDVEAVARVIADSGAEVVVLQEISRGWFLNGSADLLPLLARRLDLPYTVMGATTDPLWGSAIFSRYPILATDQGDLPRLDTLIGRGYVWAQIDLGAGDEMLFFATHLHHEEHRSEVHIPQVETVLAAWDARPQTVLLGDMNSLPGRPEMQMILDAGFTDAWMEAGEGSDFTFPAHAPDRRLDWIFHTPDLVARDVVVIESQASDHFAVAATIGLAR